MSRISLDKLWQIGRERFDDPLMWNEINSFFDKIPFFFTMRKEDPFLWRSFKKKLSKQPPQAQEKVRKIFKKHNIDINKDVIGKKHVDLALSALHTMYVSDLGENVTRLSPSKVAEKIEVFSQNLPPLSKLQDPKGDVQTLYQLVCQDALSREKEKSVFVKVLGTLKTPFAYWEYLTKQVAGRDLEEGMIIPAFGGQDFYYIYKKINQSGLIAYALKRLCETSDLKPVLFFRPTQMALGAENMVETLMDNLSLHGVGYGGFYAAAGKLEKLMEDGGFRSPEDKIIVAGYSLGGVHAQRFIAHRDNWKHFSEAIIFNASGIDERTAKRFAQKVNQGSSLLPYTPSLSFFRTEGDPIDQGGEFHVGSGMSRSSNIDLYLIQVIPHNESENFLSRHLACYLQGDAEVEVIDLKKPQNQHLLNNNKRGKGKILLEDLRKFFGFVFTPIYRFFLSLYMSVRHYFLARQSKSN